MASADVSLRLDEANRIWFAHSPYKALLFALISFGFTATCYYAIQDEPTIRWLFVAFSLLFVLAGIAGVFWRVEVDIDLVGRRIRILRGMWPSPKDRNSGTGSPLRMSHACSPCTIAVMRSGPSGALPNSG